jgi:hypothetical protein
MQTPAPQAPEDQLRHPWKALIAGIALYAILVMVWYYLEWMIESLPHGNAWYNIASPYSNVPSRGFMRLLSVVGGLFTFGLATWIWLMFKGESSDLMPKKHIGVKGLALASLIYIVALPFLSPLIFHPDFFSMLEPFRESIESSTRNYNAGLKPFFEDRGIFAFLANLVVVSLVPAIVEELFYRRFLARALQGIMGLHAAVWVSAIAFSYLHFEWEGFLQRILMGALFGYLYLYSGDLKASIVVHALNNLLYVLWMSFGWNPLSWVGPDLVFWLGIGSFLCTSALLFIFGRRFHHQEQDLET